MRAQIVRMNFLGPLHIGNREGSLEGTLHHIPSDTLFPDYAMCIAVCMVRKPWNA